MNFNKKNDAQERRFKLLQKFREEYFATSFVTHPAVSQQHTKLQIRYAVKS